MLTQNSLFTAPPEALAFQSVNTLSPSRLQNHANRTSTASVNEVHHQFAYVSWSLIRTPDEPSAYRTSADSDRTNWRSRTRHLTRLGNLPRYILADSFRRAIASSVQVSRGEQVPFHLAIIAQQYDYHTYSHMHIYGPNWTAYKRGA